jgi:hypothetical protein
MLPQQSNEVGIIDQPENRIYSSADDYAGRKN